MTFDAGMLTVCELKNTAERGDMPRETLVKRSEHFYGERTVGVTRLYAAMGVNRQIDKLVRIWEDRGIDPTMYAQTEDGRQYRITAVQHMLDEDGLKVSDLTLERLDKMYDIDIEN